MIQINNKQKSRLIISVIIIIICIIIYFILKKKEAFLLNKIYTYTISNGIDTYQTGYIDDDYKFNLIENKKINSSKYIAVSQVFIYSFIFINKPIPINTTTSITTPPTPTQILNVKRINFITNDIIINKLDNWDKSYLVLSVCCDDNDNLFILYYKKIIVPVITGNGTQPASSNKIGEIGIYQLKFTDTTNAQLIQKTPLKIADVANTFTNQLIQNFHIQLFNSIKYLNIAMSFKDDDNTNIIKQYKITGDVLSTTSLPSVILSKEYTYPSIYIINKYYYYISYYYAGTFNINKYAIETNSPIISVSTKSPNTTTTNANTTTTIPQLNQTIQYTEDSLIYGSGTNRICCLIINNINNDNNNNDTIVLQQDTNKYISLSLLENSTTGKALSNSPIGNNIIFSNPYPIQTPSIEIQKQEVKRGYEYQNTMRFNTIDNQNSLESLNKRLNNLLTKIHTKNTKYITPDTSNLKFY